MKPSHASPPAEAFAGEPVTYRTIAAQVDAMLLGGNGALTLGADLSQAFLRMELLEHYAKILTAARQLGQVPPLPPADLAKLLEARKKAGLGPAQKTSA